MVKKLPSEAQLRFPCDTPTSDGWMVIRSKFPLGNFQVSPRADKLLSGREIGCALKLHAQGDWGNVCVEARARNNQSLEHGGRLLSKYCNHADVEFYILTEADRSGTFLFLPDESERYLPANMQGDGNGLTSKEK
jgi:hypothetical protein